MLAVGWVCTAAARGGPGDAAEEPECGAGPGERCPRGRRLLQRGGQPGGPLPRRRHWGRPPPPVAGQGGGRPSLYEVRTNFIKKVLRIRDVFPRSWIRIFSIRDPHQSILTQKTGSKLEEIWPGLLIPDPDLDFFTHPWSRIQGTKRHRIPDPDPQRCIQIMSTLNIIVMVLYRIQI